MFNGVGGREERRWPGGFKGCVLEGVGAGGCVL